MHSSISGDKRLPTGGPLAYWRRLVSQGRIGTTTRLIRIIDAEHQAGLRSRAEILAEDRSLTITEWGRMLDLGHLSEVEGLGLARDAQRLAEMQHPAPRRELISARMELAATRQALANIAMRLRHAGATLAPPSSPAQTFEDLERIGLCRALRIVMSELESCPPIRLSRLDEEPASAETNEHRERAA